MTISKKNLIWVIVALFTIFIFGMGVGYKSKKCQIIETTKVVSDTFYSSYPIEVDRVVKVPINKVSHDTITIVKKGENIHTLDTIIQVVNGTFISHDTLSHDSIFVALKDSGNCNGIMKREYQFYGAQKQREIVKTITNNIILPQSLLQLNLGVVSSFNKGFSNVVDIAPMVQLEYRKKYQASYSFQFNQKQHNISVSTKIK